jgi:hypothetical protein
MPASNFRRHVQFHRAVIFSAAVRAGRGVAFPLGRSQFAQGSNLSSELYEMAISQNQKAG